MTECITNDLAFSRHQRRAVLANFKGGRITSDAGLLLVREADRSLGLIDALAECLTDWRDPSRIEHELRTMLAQRVFAIIAGYEDGNDHQTLRNDPFMKIITDAALDEESPLASPSTLSRFENNMNRASMVRVVKQLIDQFINSYAKPPEEIILDFDATDDPVHGRQEGRFFHGYYDQYCYLPLYVFCGDQLLVPYLRPSNIDAPKHTRAILKLLVKRLRQAFPGVRIIVRGDAHFSSPGLMDWCHDQPKINFITGLSGNKRQHKLAGQIIADAQNEYEQTGKKVKHYAELSYQAGSWSRAERVIVKVEVTHLGTNIRYVVTDSRRYRARHIYEKGYCSRGKMELYIKDHKSCLHSDRASCPRFQANQFRLLLHSAAYVLMHTLRTQVLRGTRLARATFATIQARLLKVAGWVRELKTKISIELPHSYPYQPVFGKALHVFGHLRS
jgi:hypothetical protein